MYKNGKSVAPILSCALIAGCAAQVYRPPNPSEEATTVEFVARFHSDRTGTDSAQVLAFRDSKSCAKHPNGVYMGLLCPTVAPGYACAGMSFSQPVLVGKPITLKHEYVFGGITSKHGRCNNQFTFTPQLGIKYRAMFMVDQEGCGTVVHSSRNGTDWAEDKSVSYDDRLCIWW